ncbi:hypothetical protein E2562_020086 [Oryza meyeriana var. granulata]|uniref:Secreted protein n=1 Tax=Oryza meyeriana var. granulata TaxID=110450 RepID=A0A6G1EAU8_9ORYZ|nr:hypothetical protein E2562_020086 [Oryza meyeriana var. granulata]
MGWCAALGLLLDLLVLQWWWLCKVLAAATIATAISISPKSHTPVLNLIFYRAHLHGPCGLVRCSPPLP